MHIMNSYLEKSFFFHLYMYIIINLYWMMIINNVYDYYLSQALCYTCFILVYSYYMTILKLSFSIGTCTSLYVMQIGVDFFYNCIFCVNMYISFTLCVRNIHKCWATIIQLNFDISLFRIYHGYVIIGSLKSQPLGFFYVPVHVYILTSLSWVFSHHIQ